MHIYHRSGNFHVKINLHDKISVVLNFHGLFDPRIFFRFDGYNMDKHLESS